MLVLVLPVINLIEPSGYLHMAIGLYFNLKPLSKMLFLILSYFSLLEALPFCLPYLFFKTEYSVSIS